MNKYVKLVGFGFLIWLIPFLVSFVIFPLRNTHRPLFESIMPVVLVLAVMIISVLYFKKIEKESLKEGVIAGVLWFVLSLVIDLMLFLPASPMQMSFSDYMVDIGLTYLIILMIPIGIGALVRKK
jgi:flagellar biosynthesis protein FlhB